MEIPTVFAYRHAQWRVSVRPEFRTVKYPRSPDSVKSNFERVEFVKFNIDKRRQVCMLNARRVFRRLQFVAQLLLLIMMIVNSSFLIRSIDDDND